MFLFFTWLFSYLFIFYHIIISVVRANALTLNINNYVYIMCNEKYTETLTTEVEEWYHRICFLMPLEVEFSLWIAFSASFEGPLTKLKPTALAPEGLVKIQESKIKKSLHYC